MYIEIWVETWNFNINFGSNKLLETLYILEIMKCKELVHIRISWWPVGHLWFHDQLFIKWYLDLLTQTLHKTLWASTTTVSTQFSAPLWMNPLNSDKIWRNCSSCILKVMIMSLHQLFLYWSRQRKSIQTYWSKG